MMFERKRKTIKKSNCSMSFIRNHEQICSSAMLGPMPAYSMTPYGVTEYGPPQVHNLPVCPLLTCNHSCGMIHILPYPHSHVRPDESVVVLPGPVLTRTILQAPPPPPSPAPVPFPAPLPVLPPPLQPLQPLPAPAPDPDPAPVPAQPEREVIVSNLPGLKTKQQTFALVLSDDNANHLLQMRSYARVSSEFPYKLLRCPPTELYKMQTTATVRSSTPDAGSDEKYEDMSGNPLPFQHDAVFKNGVFENEVTSEDFSRLIKMFTKVNINQQPKKGKMKRRYLNYYNKHKDELHPRLRSSFDIKRSRQNLVKFCEYRRFSPLTCKILCEFFDGSSYNNINKKNGCWLKERDGSIADMVTFYNPSNLQEWVNKSQQRFLCNQGRLRQIAKQKAIAAQKTAAEEVAD